MLSEDGPWANDTVNYGYTSQRLRQSLGLQQPNASEWTQTYAYDSLRRLTNINSPAGAFGYRYLQGEIWNLEGVLWEYYDDPPASGTALPGAGSLVTRLDLPTGGWITNAFNARVRLTGTVLYNSSGVATNRHEYEVNDLDQRMKQTRMDGSYVNYSYDDIGQLTSAAGRESGGTTNRMHEQFGYDYDAAGNLNWRTNNELIQHFSVNDLNELTIVGRSGTFTVAGGVQGSPSSVTVNGTNATLYSDFSFAKDGFDLSDGTNTFTAVATDSYGRWDTNTVSTYLPATVTFAYDLNGNLRTNGTRILDYDDENQLISVTEPGAWKSEFGYDGKMRRRVRKEYIWSSGLWALTSETRYVYDGNLVVQERNGQNLPHVTYTRGKDLSGTLEGAGGIGGLLARTDNALLAIENPAAHAYYHADGNGNVTALINVSELVVARYLYDPFGNTISATGPLAEANLYRFSSKELHLASGLIYYLYRFYEPALHRWANRDPIQESGGYNLYGFVRNRPLTLVDPDGRVWGGMAPAAVAAAFAAAQVALEACPAFCGAGTCSACCNAAFVTGLAALAVANVGATTHCLMLPYPFSGACGALVLTTFLVEVALLGNEVLECQTDCAAKNR